MANFTISEFRKARLFGAQSPADFLGKPGLRPVVDESDDQAVRRPSEQLERPEAVDRHVRAEEVDDDDSDHRHGFGGHVAMLAQRR